jgi:hypothetical protein
MAFIGDIQAMKRVVILVKSSEEKDQKLAKHIENQLILKGYSVHVDAENKASMAWARDVTEKIRDADAVVPLLSDKACHSEIIAFQIETAHDAAQKQKGSPMIIPCRVGFTKDLPEPIGGILATVTHLLWETEEDNHDVVQDLDERIKRIESHKKPSKLTLKPGLRLVAKPTPKPRPIRVTIPIQCAPKGPLPLEPIGGAVPLQSDFYIKREVDGHFREALTRYDSIVLLKGARQIGKTSLLARGLQMSRERGAKVALTDFQKFNASNLEDVTHFYISLAESLAEQLEVDALPADTWDERQGPNVNFERFVSREILKPLNAPLVWGLDEVDRLFTCDFGSEVFGLFRSWHNERALEPGGPWAGLTLCIAYATEAHLFISDMNQSPFNVGTRLGLEDFSLRQVQELDQRYGNPLKTEEKTQRFIELVGGHPFLVRQGLHELATKKHDFEMFCQEADKDDGVFGDHLRRIMVLLAKDPELTEIIKGVLGGLPCPTPESFYRLRSAGILSGNALDDCALRCQLYTRFLKRHLI